MTRSARQRRGPTPPPQTRCKGGRAAENRKRVAGITIQFESVHPRQGGRSRSPARRWEQLMSSLLAAPEMLASAATDLATIGSTLSAAHMAAVAPTLALMPAAADEVSASIAHVFSVHAQDYQGLAGQA